MCLRPRSQSGCRGSESAQTWIERQYVEGSGYGLHVMVELAFLGSSLRLPNLMRTRFG